MTNAKTALAENAAKGKTSVRSLLILSACDAEHSPEHIE